MHLFRAQNPEAVELFRDKIIEEDDCGRDEIADMIKTGMEQSPETTLCLVLLDDDKVVAFVFGFIPERRKHLFIYQAWRDKFVDLSFWPKYIFSRLVAYCDSHELNEIRCETVRSSEAFYRKWKFEEYSKVLRFQIRKEIEAKEDFEDEAGLES